MDKSSVSKDLTTSLDSKVDPVLAPRRHSLLQNRHISSNRWALPTSLELAVLTIVPPAILQERATRQGIILHC